AICAIEVRRRGARRNVDHPALQIDSHPGPVIGCARIRPSILRPSLVSILAWPWNGMEGPAQFAVPRVVSPDISVRSRKAFAFAATHDEQILVDDTWTGKTHGLLFRIAVQVPMQIDTPVLPET